jgi:ubiquitin-protein ligase
MNALSNSQILDDDILFELEKFKLGSIKKRIMNELIEFKQKDHYVHVEFEENDTDSNYSTIKVTIVPNGEDTIYSFNITRDFPFKPPINFTINYKNYRQYLKIDSPKTMEELRKYNGISCLCCNTISCTGNWSPVFRMKSLIIEYKQTRRFRRNIIYRLLAKKISDKYLVSDIYFILVELLV